MINMKNIIYNFDEWVSKNNPINIKNYQNGFWSYIENIRLISHDLDFFLFVIGEYKIETPPPIEELILPIVLIKSKKNNSEFIIKEFFQYGGFADTFIIYIDENINLEKIDYFSNDINNHKKKDEMIIKNITNKKARTVQNEFALYALIKYINSYE